MDTYEEEMTFIAMYNDPDNIIPNKTTHVEIHPSLILGVMANQINFPENNPLPRVVFFLVVKQNKLFLYIILIIKIGWINQHMC